MKSARWIMLAAGMWLASSAYSQNCVDCHTKETPNIVSDWKISKHSQNEVGCEDCHGSAHS